MQRIPSAARQPGRKTQDRRARALRRGLPTPVVPAPTSDIPLPSGFSAAGADITIVEGPTLKTNTKGVLPGWRHE